MAAGKQPRSLIRVNGTVISGQVSWEVTNNSYYEADTYHLLLATDKLPTSMNAAWFSQQTETFIEILAGFPSNPDNPDPSELTSFIYGRIDDQEFDPHERSLILTGRDLTGALIDNKISQQYQNQTSSQIATQIASNHGLTPNVTATTTKVGNYFEIDYMELQPNRSEWDILTYLARQEGFVTYVNGQTLYFGPDDTGTGNTLAIVWQPGDSPVANSISMRFSRSQTVVKGITVTVRSAGRLGDTVTKSYPQAPKAIAAGKASPFGGTTNYYFNMPAGTTPFQAEQRAQEIYHQIIEHAMKVKLLLPGDVTTTPQSTLTISGIGASYDQTYFPRLITRSMSMDDGFRMEIDAQNTSPNLTP